MYLSLITDAYTHEVVGYALHDTLDTTGPLKALGMALYRPDRKSITVGTIFFGESLTFNIIVDHSRRNHISHRRRLHGRHREKVKKV